MFILAFLAVLAAEPLAQWNFEDNQWGGWSPNTHLPGAGIAEGMVSAEAKGHDPYLAIRDLNLPAKPWQCFKIRIRASEPGQGELFWSGTYEGRYGGLSQDKSIQFQISGDNEWHTLTLLPFWQSEGTIKQLRLDLYDGGKFSIDEIVIEDAAPDREPLLEPVPLDAPQWQHIEGTGAIFSPPLRIPVDRASWISVTVNAAEPGAGALLWATASSAGLREVAFDVAKGEQTINVEAQGESGYAGELLALGLRLPEGAALESVEPRMAPGGPARLAVNYLGAENALNRAGNQWTLLAQIQNLGGEPAQLSDLSLETEPGIELLEAPVFEQELRLPFEATQDFRWIVRVPNPGPAHFQLLARGGKDEVRAEAEVKVLPPLRLPRAQYVPAPEPVETEIDVAAYYFPGWESVAKWDPIRRTAPNRKPLLGYYDETNPEVVDWQIKWASENGISCFLVDWYWAAGRQHLTHWFDAYRKAQYRDQLKVAIMWANHNSPGTHSRDDWRAVTKEWIEQYFTLPAYYRIDGKPTIFLWDPRNLRGDLGSSEEVKAALDESREMARAAGYPGIYFATLFGHESDAGARELEAEGYDAMTNYHEWGKADTRSKNPKLYQYKDVVDTVGDSWNEKDARSGGMDYFPVADTGWDARPWHGGKSLVIEGRTPQLFAELLRKQKVFAEETGKKLVVLGPVNEWGEGSYIEPNTEFGFEMLEAVRDVYAEGEHGEKPLNYGPRDVALGPYDIPEPPAKQVWDFEDGTEGWSAMMGVEGFEAREGALHFTSATTDPALLIALSGVDASRVSEAVLSLGATAPGTGKVHGQVFWTTGRGATSEGASEVFSYPADGALHEIRLSLGRHARWRGRITSLRLDPCTQPGLKVVIDKVALE